MSTLPQDTLDTPAPVDTPVAGDAGVPVAKVGGDVDGAAVVAGLHCVLRSFCTCLNAFLSDGEFDFKATWMQAVESLVMGGVGDSAATAEQRFLKQMDYCIWDPEREVEVAEGVAGPTGVVDLYHSSVGMLCRVFEQIQTQAVPVRGIVPTPGQTLPARVAAQRYKERQAIYARAHDCGTTGAVDVTQHRHVDNAAPTQQEFYRGSQSVGTQKKVAAMLKRRMAALASEAAPPAEQVPTGPVGAANPMCDVRRGTRTAKVRHGAVGATGSPMKRRGNRALPGLVDSLDVDPNASASLSATHPPAQGAHRLNLEPLRDADFTGEQSATVSEGDSRPPSRLAHIVVDPFGRPIEPAKEGKGVLWLRKEPCGPSQDSWVYSGTSDPRERETEKEAKMKLEAISNSVTVAGPPASGVRAKRAQQRAKEHSKQLESRLSEMCAPKRLVAPQEGGSVPQPVEARERAHWSKTSEIRVHSRHDPKAQPVAPMALPVDPEVEEIMNEMEPPQETERGLFSEHVAALKRKARDARREPPDPNDIDTSPMSIAVDTR